MESERISVTQTTKGLGQNGRVYGAYQVHRKMKYKGECSRRLYHCPVMREKNVCLRTPDEVSKARGKERTGSL
jgi:hypothetical protein